MDLVDLHPATLAEMNSFLPPAWSHGNPLDLVGDSGVDLYARVFDFLLKHQEFWDIAFIVSVPDAVLDPTQLAQEVVRFSRNTRKMVVGCFLGGASVASSIQILRAHHIPNFADLEDAFRVVGRATVVKAQGNPGNRGRREDIQPA